MNARAIARNVRVSPRKARFVVDLIRGKNANTAIAELGLLRNRAAQPVLNVLQSALANADQRDPEADIDEFRILRAFVDEGRTMKRYRPRAMGRATQIRKRSSHITLEVGI